MMAGDVNPECLERFCRVPELGRWLGRLRSRVRMEFGLGQSNSTQSRGSLVS